MEWFYAKDGQQLGPVSSQEIESLIKDGAILATSLVWREGMPEWKPAKEVLTLPGTSEQAAASPEPTPTSPEPTPTSPEPTPASPEPTPASPEPTPASPEPTPASSQPDPQPAASQASPAQVTAPAAAQSGAAPIAPGTVNPYLWQSICCIVLCCWPFAIPALIFSLKVNPALERGDRAEAESASAQAKKWCIISASVAVVVWVLYLAFILVLGGMGALG